MKKQEEIERKRLNVALVQMCSTDDARKNFLHVQDAILTVAKNVDCVCFPENTFYLRAEGERIQWDPSLGKDILRVLSMLAEHEQTFIFIGSFPVRGETSTKIFNTSLLFNPDGKIIARYEKIHLFDVTLPDGRTLFESRFVAPGKRIVTASVRGWNLGLSICYDLRFPELYRKLRKKNADVLMIPSAFTVPTGKDHWETLLRARAIENQCYVLAPAQTGKHSPTRESYGHSMVIDPWGKIIASAKDGEEIIYATLDDAIIRGVREKMPCWENRRLSV